jgi:hypothetical protein
MHRTTIATLAAGLTAALTCAGAGAAMMHPELGAKLAGMGESGIVNLTANTTTNKLCWTFDLPMVAATGASIRDAAGMRVAALGSMYAAKGCTSSSAMVLDELETKPGAYHVWVDTKNHPGDLRGTLFAGMAAMMHA